VFEASDAAQRQVAWHHLVLAVGNFKRQSGRRLRPTRLSELPALHDGSQPDELKVTLSTRDVTIGKSDELSWEQLQNSLAGAGVATTCTILAALWPGDHVVFDWRVRAAANGLRLAAGLEPTNSVEVDSSASPPLGLGDYQLIRSWIVDAATVLKVEPSDVERTLYRLSQLVGPATDRRTWREYAEAVVVSLRSANSDLRTDYEGDDAV
jgi:hypothetical protein